MQFKERKELKLSLPEQHVYGMQVIPAPKGLALYYVALHMALFFT